MFNLLDLFQFNSTKAEISLLILTIKGNLLHDKITEVISVFQTYFSFIISSFASKLYN